MSLMIRHEHTGRGLKAKTVLLVDPPYHAFLEYDRWWYSFSCAQLAACLRDQGIEAYVYDADKYFKKDPRTRNREEMVRRQAWYSESVGDTGHLIWKHFCNTLMEIKPDVVAVASWTSKQQSVVKALELSKACIPGVKTCVGGYHASAVPEVFLNNPLVDGVFIGPADHTLAKWVHDGCHERLIVADPHSIDVCELPAPAREALLLPEKYSSDDMGMLMTSRGCPYNCSFCCNKLLTGLKYQHRTVGQVRQEIEHVLDRYGVTHLNIADANFLVNVKRTLEIVDVFESFPVTWSAEARIDAIDDAILDRFIASGCRSLCFGIESGTDAGMKRLNKDITTEQVRKAGELLNRRGLDWKCFFIVGFPHETLDDMDQTREFALSIGATYISLNSFVPLPGTDIYDEWKGTFEGLSDDIYEYSQLHPRATFVQGASVEAYREKFLSILRDFEAYNKARCSVDRFRTPDEARS